MLIDASLGQMFQEQMNREFSNQLAYEALEAPMKTVPWDGFAKFFHNAGQDEFQHYEKFNDFLVDRNVTPQFTMLTPPFSSGPREPIDAFRAALGLEQANTLNLKDLEQACTNVGDSAARNWLIWALEEQVQSEKELTDIINMLDLAGVNDAAIRLIDEKVGGG